jgi:nucleoside-diphosphate-sugar epimerase
MANLLITGANGFVGRHACVLLRDRGFSVRAFSRQPFDCAFGVQSFSASSLSHINCLSPALNGADYVLHLAGRAHVMHDSESDPLLAFRNANVYETLKLAREAALAGVKRFVYVSSIKVNGEFSTPSSPFTESDKPNPLDPYALSKCEAEIGLQDIALQTGIEIVIVRPPLIYGLGVKGNFRAMMKLLAREVPLPLGSVTNNRRSLTSLENLVDFLGLCLLHPKASGRVFLVSDQHDVSTAQLLRILGEAMGVSVQLLPVPLLVLRSSAILARKRSVYQKLCASLVVDSSAATKLLGWAPPLSLEEGLRRVSTDFLQRTIL